MMHSYQKMEDHNPIDVRDVRAPLRVVVSPIQFWRSTRTEALAQAWLACRTMSSLNEDLARETCVQREGVRDRLYGWMQPRTFSFNFSPEIVLKLQPGPLLKC